MTDRVLVDTNVFVYRHDLSDPAKQKLAEHWIQLLASTREGRPSYTSSASTTLARRLQKGTGATAGAARPPIAERLSARRA